MLGISIVAYAAKDNVGGGVWDYGSTAGGVHSYYFHSQKKHSSTACKEANCDNKVYATKGNTSHSDIAKGWFDTGYTYWATY